MTEMEQLDAKRKLNDQMFTLQQQQLNQMAAMINFALKVLGQNVGWFLCVFIISVAWFLVGYEPSVLRVICASLFTGSIFAFLRLNVKGNGNG